MEVRTSKLKHLFFPVSSYSLTNLFYFYLFHFHPTLIDPLCLFIVFFNAFLCLMLSALTARYKTSPHWLLSSGKKFSCSVFLVWRYFPQTMSKLPACTLSLSVYACWIWKWKLCYLESRKSVSCSLRGKLLLLLGLLIPDGAAVFDMHSNNILLLFSDTRLSFICASCLSFVSHPPAVAGQIPPPPAFISPSPSLLPEEMSERREITSMIAKLQWSDTLNPKAQGATHVCMRAMERSGDIVCLHERVCSYV